jgi:hypothetical protein
MVGAAHYTATLQDAGHPTGFDPVHVANDYLTPILTATAFSDVPRLFFPVATHDDRGHALDKAIENDTPELANAFASLDEGERAGWRPPLVFSPMLVEDGRRLIISNRQVPYLTRAEGSMLLGRMPLVHRDPTRNIQALGTYFNAEPPDVYRRQPRQRYEPSRPDQDVYSRSAVELFRLFPDARDRLHISTAARMNASFPYVSPAVGLPTIPSRHVVDAGYYDNYGVNLAARWIYHWRDWLAKNTDGIVLIQIRDSASQFRRRHLFHADDEPSTIVGLRLRLGLSWLTGPPAGATAASGSIMSFRNDEQLAEVSAHFECYRTKTGLPFFTTVVFERPGDVAMNWYLSEEDKRNIVQAFEEEATAIPNLEQLERLKEWWIGRPPRQEERLQFRPGRLPGRPG